MLRFWDKVLIISVVAFFIPASSWAGNKPTGTDLRNALSLHVPGFVKVTSFTVEAIQNYGNEVEPVYRSRFKATVEVSDSLYKQESKQNEIIFVRLINQKGKKTDIFGKMTSVLFQGAWQHSVEIDGNPIASLGIPLNHFSVGRVIVRGSNEEKEYNAEMERKQSELRKNIANAKKILVGTWRNDNYLLINFQSDGTATSKNDSGLEAINTWEVDGDILIWKVIKRKQRSGSDWEPNNTTAKYRFIYIDENSYTIKGIDQYDSRTYTAKRVK